MNLSKEKNGVYYIYYQQPNGRRTRKSTKTKFKSEALKYLSKFEKDFEDLNSLKSNKISLRQFVSSYLKYSESIHTLKTTKGFKTTFKFFQHYLDDPQLRSISTRQINEYIRYRINISSIYQAKNDLINLKSAFNYAINNNYLLKNPCAGIKQIKIPEKQPLYFTKQEFNQLLFTIDNPDYKDLIMLAVNTGLRQMELLTLTPEQIDLKNGTITLDNRNHITKSKRIRVIPLNNKAIDILKRRIHFERIFPFTQDQTVKHFARYRKKSQIRAELSFHSLRHTFASWLVQSGIPIFNVSKLLGHADIKTTQIYAHVSNNELLNSVNVINY